MNEKTPLLFEFLLKLIFLLFSIFRCYPFFQNFFLVFFKKSSIISILLLFFIFVGFFFFFSFFKICQEYVEFHHILIKYNKLVIYILFLIFLCHLVHHLVVYWYISNMHFLRKELPFQTIHVEVVWWN